LSPRKTITPRLGVPNRILGMYIFLFVEGMLFAGLLSASTIVRSGTTVGWKMPDTFGAGNTTRLFNLFILLTSGIFARKAWGHLGNREKLLPALQWTILFGALFLVLQGAEWVELLHEGFTLKSSGRSGFFYLIVGAHAAHAFVAIVILGKTSFKVARNQSGANAIDATLLFWGFVVCLWPILFVTVYN
jgi:cytochrome c oxidase subunit III